MGMALQANAKSIGFREVELNPLSNRNLRQGQT
jgi:hypothetical protein